MAQQTNELDKARHQNAVAQGIGASDPDEQSVDFSSLYSSIPAGEYPEASAEDLQKQKQTPSARQIND